MKKLFLFVMIGLFLLSTLIIAEEGKPMICKETIAKVKSSLLGKYGENEKFRIEKGVEQAASLWLEKDGTVDDFIQFCENSFVPLGEKFDEIFARLERNSEIINGHMTIISQELSKPIDLDWGELLPIDTVFASWSPNAHISDDFFDNKLAFFLRLNFPYYPLSEKTKNEQKWNSKDWAMARMGDGFLSRVPAEINLKWQQVSTEAQAYIYDYKFYLGKLVDDNMKTYFPEDMVQISHWGVRDEITARYKDKEGFFKQKMLYALMHRVINQEVPEVIINNGDYYYNPISNKLYDKDKKEIELKKEPDTRYAVLQKTWESVTWFDKYSPELNTHIKRMFEANREIPEDVVEKLFIDVISSKEVRETAKYIEKQLGRELVPWDLWWAGFTPGGDIPEEKLDKIVKEKFGNLDGFAKAIPDILVMIGFTPEKAEFIAEHVKPEAARGAGHCSGAAIKSAQNLLRTHVPKNSIDYKGFDTAMHELGHAVEQTLTLHTVDYYALQGVPNTSFTEAFAYLFQDQGLKYLGVASEKTEKDIHIKNLATLWNAYEIMGVSLVDMRVWRWMYDHPQATPAELKAATIEIAKDIWNKYYADVFHAKDDSILAIYSHMICYYLYLPDYPMGYVILAQVQNYMEGKNIADEMQRMCKVGLVTPNQWMRNAVGEPISAKPMLKYADAAIKFFNK